MKPTKVLFVVAMVLMLAAAGCRSGKQAVKPQEAMTENWTRLQAPMSLKLEKPQRFSVTTTTTMVRDTSIVVSMRMFGMEVGLISVTADTLLILDKYHKMAIVEPTTDFFASTGTTLSDLQNLIIGDSEVTGKLAARLHATETVADDGTITLQLAAADTRLFNVTLGAPFPTAFGIFHEEMSAATEFDSKTYAAKLKWDLSRAKWNDDVTPRSVALPTSYGKASFKQLLESAR
ncbi:MAG: DUF4292 domain-containing protein [Roseburia sp.]|nr:DUF4292 domain-containing protein [Roseburia sp.]